MPQTQETGKHPSRNKNLEAESLIDAIMRHIVSNTGCDSERASRANIFRGLSYAIRDRLIERWIQTQQSYYSKRRKRVYYLSLEFLPGPFLHNNLINLGLEEDARTALNEFGLELEEITEIEPEPGLGNGGLGRLASCYLDSMASQKIPGYGYGIRYAFGIFHQLIKDGYQVEKADNWLKFGNIWEYQRPDYLYRVHFGGDVHEWTDVTGRQRYSWEHTNDVMAMACDIMIPGFKNDYVINMRLWEAHSDEGFNLDYFNHGDYVRAMQDIIHDVNISMVLYPNDESDEGKQLRFKQQYFLVSATLQDIMRRHRKVDRPITNIPEEAVIQLNETHPAIAIPELMRLMLDKELIDWDTAWDVCRKTFAYTNHTVLPEALEKWPVRYFEVLLPRHLLIIYEINRRFLEDVAARFPGDMDRLSRMSIIEEGPTRYVRMSHLAIVASRSVNGVAALHSEIIKQSIFQDFYEMYPEKFNNKTNGVTPRRFLRQANPRLTELICDHIGKDWITDLDQLRKLEPFAEKAEFRNEWKNIRRHNKQKLAAYIAEQGGPIVNPESMFDIQVKRIHEYKRQLLNLLHVITMYKRIKADPDGVHVPRTVLFGGKAAPGYWMAKQTIKCINSVADVVNNDPEVGDKLKVYFLPNYCVSLNEKLIAAADLSEQISTAGMEASGTGNMKFALNGALTIGTLDGANVEIMEEVGPENIFIFGLKADEVAQKRRDGYNPRAAYESDPELKQVLNMLMSDLFCPNEPGIFVPVVTPLLDHGDWFLLTADYRSYVDCQSQVSKLYLEQEEWTRRSILNTARMGKFSSDRAVMEYVRDIWDVKST